MGTSIEKCICQICTCGRHRCPRHPQSSLVNLPEIDPTLSRWRRSVNDLDQLKMEGSMVATGRSHEDFREFRVQRPSIKKLGATLKTSGEMDLTTSNHFDHKEHGNYSRPTITRLEDNLRQEGDMVASSFAHDVFREYVAERPVVRRQKSSLKVGSGHMQQQSLTKETYRQFQVERPKRSILQDNITSTGTFDLVSRTQEDYKEVSVERPVIKKLQDNLAVAGKESRLSAHPISRSDYTEHTYVRPTVKKTEDNLKLDGELLVTSKETGTEMTFERPVIKKLQDNLVVGSDARLSAHQALSRRDYTEHTYIRPTVKKTEDNLKMDGELLFTPKESDVEMRFERPVIKKLQDNLKVGGNDARLSAQPLSRRDYTEHTYVRPTVKKTEDNLKLDGELSIPSRDPDTGMIFERPVIKKLQDNLKVAASDARFSAQALSRRDYTEHTYVRPTVKKTEDNLKTQGGMQITAKELNAGMTFERPVIKKLQDNLKVGGSDARLSAQPLSKRDYTEHVYARPTVKKTEDSLRLDGDLNIPSKESDTEMVFERPVIKKLQDNLRVAGNDARFSAQPLSRKDYTEHTYIRPTVRKTEDNLILDGEMLITPKEPRSTMAFERPVIKKLQDNLKVSNGGTSSIPAESTSKADYVEHSYSRPTVKKTADNLTIDGEFLIPEKQTDAELRAERPVVKKLQDNLTVAGGSGRLSAKPTSKLDYVEHAYVRPTVKKTSDNLKTEGDFYAAEKESTAGFTVERPQIKKLEDNLKLPTGEFLHDSTVRTEYRGVQPHKVQIQKLKDNLKLEGEVDLSTRHKEVFIPVQVEKSQIKRLGTTLAVGGGQFSGYPVQKHDYPEHEVSRPAVNRPPESTGLYQQNASSADLMRSRRSAPDYVEGAFQRETGISRSQIKTSVELGGGKMTFSTTAQDSYGDVEHVERSKPLRPPTSNQIQERIATDISAHRDRSRRSSSRRNGLSSQPLRSLSQPARLKKTALASNLGIGLSNGQNADEYQSTSRSDYADVGINEARGKRAARPPTSIHLEGRHDLHSTSQLSYANVDAVPRVNFKTQLKATDSTLSRMFHTGDRSFDDSSLYKSTYVLPAIDRCPASVLDVPDKSDFAFVREFKSHKFYKPVVSIQ